MRRFISFKIKTMLFKFDLYLVIIYKKIIVILIVNTSKMYDFI